MLLNKIIVKRLKYYWARGGPTINWHIIFTILDDEIGILKDRTACGYCMQELNIYWLLCECGREVVCENCNECRQCEDEAINRSKHCLTCTNIIEGARCRYCDNY